MNMREHIVVGPEVKSLHDIDTPLTKIDQSFGGHVPVGDDNDDDAHLHLRSMFPISFDCLYSQDDISVDVAGTVDETEGSQDVGSVDGILLGVLREPCRTLVAKHPYQRYDNNDDSPSTNDNNNSNNEDRL